MLKVNKKDLTVSRVALFEFKFEKSKISEKEIKSADLIHDVINLAKIGSKYESLLSVLELNIKRKLMSNESLDLCKKKSSISIADSLFDGIPKRGRPIVSVVLGLKDTKNNLIDKILNADNDGEFELECKKLANNYCSLKADPKGIIGFAQFEFKISGNFERFLAILTTDFSKTIVSPDIEKALVYLKNAFDHNFKTTILYPHLVPFDNTKRTDKENISLDRSRAKVDIKKMDPDIFRATNILEPINPQLRFEKLYKEKRLSLKTLKDILNFMEPEDAQKVFLEIEAVTGDNGSIKVKVDLKTFLDNVDLIYSEDGKGLFFKNSDLKVLIKDMDIFSEQKVKFKEIDFKD